MSAKKRAHRRKPGPGPSAAASAAKQIVEVAGKDRHTDIVRRHRKPSMKFPVRSLQNVKYDVKRGHFEILGKTMSDPHAVLQHRQDLRPVHAAAGDDQERPAGPNDIAGKREVYYNSKSWGECRFDEQPESDALLDDMEAMLGINREQLGYIPEERGGDVCRAADRDRPRPGEGEDIRINCARLGTGAWSIPSRVEHLRSNARRSSSWSSRPPRSSSASCTTAITRRRSAS
jgi:DNA topoisomerase VI subunit A